MTRRIGRHWPNASQRVSRPAVAGKIMAAMRFFDGVAVMQSVACWA
jgi:hypothetical protein